MVLPESLLNVASLPGLFSELVGAEVEVPELVIVIRENPELSWGSSDGDMAPSAAAVPAELSVGTGHQDPIRRENLVLDKISPSASPTRSLTGGSESNDFRFNFNSIRVSRRYESESLRRPFRKVIIYNRSFIEVINDQESVLGSWKDVARARFELNFLTNKEVCDDEFKAGHPQIFALLAHR